MIRNSNPSKFYFSRFILSSFLMLFLLSAFNPVFSQKKKDKELEGKFFTIELTEQGGKKTPKPESDELSFKSDKFTSKLMKEKNKFGSAVYTATTDTASAEKIISFEAESKNDGGELLSWKGTITGENIEGTAVWSKKGKTKKEYAYSGSLKKKKK